MLSIRAEQLRILNEPFLKSFKAEVTAYLASDYPEQSRALGAEGVAKLIEHGMRKANEYGIELESDVCDLIGLMAEFGPDVDQQEWASSILRDNSEPAEVRIGCLVGWAKVIRRQRGKV
jgi:hypothetical protein